MPNVQKATIFAKISSMLGDDLGANDHTNLLLVHLEERISVRISRRYRVAVGLVVAFGKFIDAHGLYDTRARQNLRKRTEQRCFVSESLTDGFGLTRLCAKPIAIAEREQSRVERCQVIERRRRPEEIPRCNRERPRRRLSRCLFQERRSARRA